MALEELAGERAIGIRASPIWVVFEDGFAEAWRLAQTNAARNNCFVNAFAKVLANLCHDLGTEPGATVEHRHDTTADLEAPICARTAHLLDQPHDFHQAFESEVLALDRS